MNLGPLAGMHPVEQAIRVDLERCPLDAVGAVLAVLDLHKPYPQGGNAEKFGYECGSCYGNGGAAEYPCETVQAVADALGVTP